MAKRKPGKGSYLVRIFYAYRGLVNRPCSMDEVADWAMESGLYPSPNARSTDTEIADWEKKLAAAAAKGLVTNG